MEQSFTQELQSTLQKNTQQMVSSAHQKNDVESHMALQGLHVKNEEGKGTGKATQVDFDMALSDCWDLQESIMFRFIVIGDFAKAIREKQSFYMGKVQMAMRERQLTPEIVSLFTTWKYEKKKYGYSYAFTPPIKWDVKIPIEIHVIKRHYEFFDNPDVGFYGTNEWKLPNPFNTYWQARNLIQ